MMDMKDVSTFFDNDPLYDSYTGVYLYDGQFATYDGSQLDGSFVRRRTVSLSPDFMLPPRRVVRLFGEDWILSDPITDGFLGEKVRQTMSARKSHGLFNLLTTSEFVLEKPPARQAYGFKRWTKGTAEAGSSDLEPYFEFSFSLTEAPVKPLFITQGNQAWSPRMDTEVAEGFRLVEADAITDESEEVRRVTVEQYELDPVTLNKVLSRQFQAVAVTRYMLFRKLDQDQPQNYPGDLTLLVAEESDPEADQPMEIEGEEWTVVASQRMGDGFALHIRRVG